MPCTIDLPIFAKDHRANMPQKQLGTTENEGLSAFGIELHKLDILGNAKLVVEPRDRHCFVSVETAHTCRRQVSASKIV